MKAIGLIGLGNAGRPIGERLLKKGYRLKVYDLNPEAVESLIRLGATKSSSAQQASSEVTITVLPSSAEVKSAVFDEGGILAGFKPGYVLIDLSGTDPDCARDLEQEIKKKNCEFLGATLHAEGAPRVTIPRGLLSIVVGGNKEVLESCMDILKALAQKIICVPEPWMPKAFKIAVIMFAAGENILSAETLAWLLAQGVDPHMFLQTLQLTESASAPRVEQFFRRNNHYGGTLSNIQKDLEQALEVGSELHIPLPFTSMANQIVRMSQAQGLSRINPATAFASLYELLSGIDISQAVLHDERTLPEPGEPEVLYLENIRK